MTQHGSRNTGHEGDTMADDKLIPDYLESWALTPDIAPDPSDDGRGEIYISSEGMHNPEPSIEWFGGDFGPDKYHFDEIAADHLLSENGYLRVSPWWAGSMNGREPGGNKWALTDGRSCEVMPIGR